MDAFEPHFNVLEGVGVGDVEAEDDTLSLFVKAEGQGPEPFLPSSIPNFHLHLVSSSAIWWSVALYDII